MPKNETTSQHPSNPTTPKKGVEFPRSALCNTVDSTDVKVPRPAAGASLKSPSSACGWQAPDRVGQ